MVYHPGSGIPHNFPNPFPHHGPVAMDTAPGTYGFGITELALVKLEAGIIDKFPAFITGGDPGMMFAAVQYDHLFYSYFFYIHPIAAIIFHYAPISLLAGNLRP